MTTQYGRLQRSLVLGGLTLVAGLLGGCGIVSKGQVGLDVSARDMGMSSWYGEDFHGKLAADGRPFDRFAMTAAHRSLPLGTVVRVLNAQNGRSVHVRITDRGPYIPGRMLDLSEGAATHLGMARQGVAPVIVTVVSERTLHAQDHAGRQVPMEQLFGFSPLAPMGAVSTVHWPGVESHFGRQPEDLWRQPRLRRVVDVLAADHHVDQRSAGLFLAWIA
ncbi:MAG: septal ring lytic transglycosylase RlpA family protein [Nitrospiraceae bacterium]